jgi:RNA 3'-terminal phosphate cyclase (ATP)
VRAGECRFSVGSAGSATLVFQTVLPALMLAGAPSVVTLEGGTHNPAAPPFEFLAEAFLPLLARIGPRVSVALERPGFYPAGGGRFTAIIEPAGALARLGLGERGEVIEREVRVVIASLNRRIAERELGRLRERLAWPPACFQAVELPAAQGPGNVVLCRVRCREVTEVFSGFGQRGVRAERVADDVATQALGWLSSGVPVGPQLCDQLLLPLALARGGSFRTGPLSQHARTQIEILGRFLSVPVRTHQDREGSFTIEVG